MEPVGITKQSRLNYDMLKNLFCYQKIMNIGNKKEKIITSPNFSLKMVIELILWEDSCDVSIFEK